MLPPIVYEDETMLAFDKPSGLLVAPDRWDKNRPYLMRYVHERYGHDTANVHRIDADTSGLLLCSRTKPALDYLSGQFQSKTPTKIYHAIVVILPPGREMKIGAALRDPVTGLLPDEFTADLALGQDEAHPGRMRVFKKRGGKPSITHFRTLERFGPYALVECRPETGRTHQIRIHLAALGAPIIGDPFYGDSDIGSSIKLSDLKRGYKGCDDEKPLIARLALHASQLTLKHPTTREPVTLTAPLPKDFELALKNLRKHTPGAAAKKKPFPSRGNTDTQKKPAHSVFLRASA
ncbi:RluA family pseudouridine synthase [Geminisphaera colitermitum]|uniref:RluA family pseudouridine synthase n=1 Tax=Geminisphaera colitermitum TaxID=1148786 RepID=UPI0006939846|nr:pseudouridine synthase [Geminisphaera colitermitum]